MAGVRKGRGRELGRETKNYLSHTFQTPTTQAIRTYFCSGGSRPSDKRGPVIQTLRDERGGGAVSKKVFSALRASVWSKNKQMDRNEHFPPFELSSAAIKIGV